MDEPYGKSLIRKITEIPTALFKGADRVNIEQAFMSGYVWGKRLGMPQKYAIMLGDEVAMKTQFLYTKMMATQFSRGSIGRTMSLFTSWPTNYFGFLGSIFNQTIHGAKPWSVLAFEKATGTVVKFGFRDQPLQRSALYVYGAMVGLGSYIQSETRFNVLNYIGFSSPAQVSELIGGDVPGLETYSNAAKMATGFITQNDYQLAEGWAYFQKPENLIGITRQLKKYFAGEVDELSLFFYMKGKDFYHVKKENEWKDEELYTIYDETESKEQMMERGLDEFDIASMIESGEYVSRKQLREENPELDAKLFIIGDVRSLLTNEAIKAVERLIEENDINTEFIPAYWDVFGFDIEEVLKPYLDALGSETSLGYITTNKLSTQFERAINKAGESRSDTAGVPLMNEWLDARALIEWYDEIEINDDNGEPIYQVNRGKKIPIRDWNRMINPELDAILFFWGRVETLKSQQALDLVRALMVRYGIFQTPSAILAFKNEPDKYKEFLKNNYRLEPRRGKRF